MKIDLRELAQGQSRLDMEITGASVGLTPSEVALEGPLALSLHLDRRGEEIWIRGQIHTIALQQCSRCLVDFSQILALDFEVFCARVQNPRVESHPALDEEDGGVHMHDGKILSIDGEIREAVILGLPMRPLCRDDCAGLCPRCGEDRNLGPCRCAQASAEGGSSAAPKAR